MLALYTGLLQIIEKFLKRSKFNKVNMTEIYHSKLAKAPKVINWKDYIKEDD